MLSGSYVNPRTCVLPFEMFRSFGPALNEDGLGANGLPEEENRAGTEVISSKETPQLESKGAELRHLEFQLGQDRTSGLNHLLILHDSIHSISDLETRLSQHGCAACCEAWLRLAIAPRPHRATPLVRARPLFTSV